MDQMINGRHTNTTVVLMCTNLDQMPASVRDNADYVVFDTEKLPDEIANLFDEDVRRHQESTIGSLDHTVLCNAWSNLQNNPRIQTLSLVDLHQPGPRIQRQYSIALDQAEAVSDMTEDVDLEVESDKNNTSEPLQYKKLQVQLPSSSMHFMAPGVQTLPTWDQCNHHLMKSS